MTRSSRQCLFGGTLLAAGLIGGPAADAQFIVGNCDYAGAAVAGTGSNASAFSGPFDHDVDLPGGRAIAYGGPNLFAAGASISFGVPHPYFAAASFYDCYFTVAQDAPDAFAIWNFTDDDGSGYIRLFEVGFGFLLNEALGAGGALTGFVPLSLEASKTYRLDIATSVSDPGAKEPFGALAIPSPASSSLLALSGILATRRRRN